MELFTGYEYLLIDAANQHGEDKLLFSQRIQWAEDNMAHLEAMTDTADEPELFQKSVSAIRKAQNGLPTGHRVGLDATCSGIQDMSALPGCEAGCNATGLVDPNRRADAYADVTTGMNQILAKEGLSVSIPRSDAKQAVMTSFYGSRKEPKSLFGEDTPELAAFYQAIQEAAPGAFELLQDLLGTWQPFTLMHRWILPDGFVARVKVHQKVEKRLEIDELDHATFTYEWFENEGQESGLSNVANVVHSVDAYLLRSLIRRCSYDIKATQQAVQDCFMEILYRDTAGTAQSPIDAATPQAIRKYIERFEATNMVDAVIIPYLNAETTQFLTTDHLRRLNTMMEEMLDYPPFAMTSVHDEFSCHPNHMNVLRQQYTNIFAEMADSTILDDIFSVLTGTTGTYPKLSNTLSHKIRRSNYAIC